MPPSIDKAFDAFVNWQTIVFCLGVYVITYTIRTAVETLWKGAKTNNFWNEFGLHIGPIGTGVGLALLAKTFPWPMPIMESNWTKFMYGGICGMASGWVYGRFRAWLKIASVGNPTASKILSSTPSVPPTTGDNPPGAGVPPAEGK